MIYSSILASMGLLMVYAGFHENLKLLFALGMILFLAGQLTGYIIEERMSDRIKKLEDKLKESELNGKGNPL